LGDVERDACDVIATVFDLTRMQSNTQLDIDQGS
jgi:hypothetical protein